MNYSQLILERAVRNFSAVKADQADCEKAENQAVSIKTLPFTAIFWNEKRQNLLLKAKINNCLIDSGKKMATIPRVL